MLNAPRAIRTCARASGIVAVGAWLLACVVALGQPVGGGTPPPTYSAFSSQPRQILVRLPQVSTNEEGSVVIEPRLGTSFGDRPMLRRPTRIAGDVGMPTDVFIPPTEGLVYLEPQPGMEWIAPPPGVVDGELPPPSIPAEIYEGEILTDDAVFPPWEEDAWSATAEPEFRGLLQHIRQKSCERCGPLSFLFPKEINPYPDAGFGIERVEFAPFFIDVTQPQRMYRMRFDAVYDLEFPDRAEAFWARPSNLSAGMGPPAPEPSVTYQDFAFAWETGTEIFSLTTHVPIRVLDPVNNANTAGLSDLTTTTKLRLYDGSHWQITQIMSTHVKTGAVSKGLSTGHVSLEPGILLRYRVDPATYLHAEVKYWFAVGGHPEHSGQILRWGLGASRVLYEHDTFAIIPTLEFIELSFLDGQRAVFPPLAAVDIDGENVYNLHPGLRIVGDTGCDMGIVELGVASGIELGSVGWWDRMLRVELRWIY
ncbi:MAG: hypothetical protein KY475_13150 [Planctomycetes bacterium]|nr:hypothetical protein [Planctomycetota bacterium]